MAQKLLVRTKFKNEKLEKNSKLVQKLAAHANKSPQNVYHAFTKGVQNKLSFLSRTTPDTRPIFEATETILSNTLIPALTGRPRPSEDQRRIFSLPTKNGGLNIQLPEDHEHDLEWSHKMTACLDSDDIPVAEQSQAEILQQIRKQKSEIINCRISELKDKLTHDELYALELASEKGASSWLNALPIKRLGFSVTKSEFRDGLTLRYGWEPQNVPNTCPCGEKFCLSHVLHCPKGGYTHMRHDEIRDTFAEIMKDVCFDVELEPKLQPLEGESFANRTTTTEDDARLDIKANGLWESRFSRTFFDVKVFNPHARSCPKNTKEAYKHHESMKKLKYEQRIIDVENSTFNPLVFACTGGAGPSASKVMSRLALKISEKSIESYADVIGYIRTKVSFALLRSSVLCLRGCRSLKRKLPNDSSIGAVVEEGRLS